MSLPVVTAENYYSPEMNMAYMGSTQFKAFEKCEAAALAEDLALSLRSGEYGAEPFVLPADSAYAPGKEGRAGWSWYTGAAGWYLRLLRELYGTEP